MMMHVLSANRVDSSSSNIHNNWKVEKEKRKSFHDIIKGFLFVSQFFGLMPVSGLLGRVSSLSFSFISFRMIYQLLIFTGMTCMFVLQMIELIRSGITFYRSTAPLFTMFNIITNLLTIKMSYDWPKLMQDWVFTEDKLRFYSTNTNLKARIYIAYIVFGICGSLEHMLSIISNLIISQKCRTTGNRFQAYYEILFSLIFTKTSFSVPKAVIAQHIDLSSVYTWNFTDLLILVMSVGITDLFKRITWRMQQLQLKNTHESVWREIREDYNQVVNLCHHLNETISGLVFLSYANNLYFICAQLLHTIKAPQNAVEVIYFYYSLIYLVIRTLVLTLIASKINDESRAPLQILFNIPSYSYCSEMTRFIQQINSEIIALTGLNFFSVRRGIILTVAGTIVTYELVLVQFSTETEVLKSQTNNTQEMLCLHL